MNLESRLAKVERTVRIGDGDQSVRIVTGVPRNDEPSDVATPMGGYIVLQYRRPS